MRKLIVLLIVVITAACTAVNVSANRPSYLGIIYYEIPEDAFYIDLLIRMDETSEYYTDHNIENMARYDFNTDELRDYNEDGFVSFSYHFKNNITEMILDKTDITYGSANKFDYEEVPEEGKLKRNSWALPVLMEQRSELKAAVLNSDGKIIRTSETFRVQDDTGYIANGIRYNIQENKVSVDWQEDHSRDIELIIKCI